MKTGWSVSLLRLSRRGAAGWMALTVGVYFLPVVEPVKSKVRESAELVSGEACLCPGLQTPVFTGHPSMHVWAQS